MDASVSVGPPASGHPTIDPVGHEVVAIPAEDASAGDPSLTKSSAKKPKFVPKPPKRRTKFGTGHRGDRSKKNPRTSAVASVGDGAAVSPAASAPSESAPSTRSKKQKVERANHLLRDATLKKNHLILELRSEVVVLKSDAAFAKREKKETADEVDCCVLSVNNRMKAMKELHLEEMEKKDKELKRMAEMMSSQRNISNEVTLVHFFFYCCLYSLVCIAL